MISEGLSQRIYNDLDYLILRDKELQPHIKQPIPHFYEQRLLISFSHTVNAENEQVNELLYKIDGIIDILQQSFDHKCYFKREAWIPGADDVIAGVYILVSDTPFRESLQVDKMATDAEVDAYNELKEKIKR